MCLVYMYHCRVCNYLFRNYRRWPRFCKKAYCTKLYQKDNWTLSIPCVGAPCTEEECSILVRPKDGLCVNCKWKLDFEAWLYSDRDPKKRPKKRKSDPDEEEEDEEKENNAKDKRKKQRKEAHQASLELQHSAAAAVDAAAVQNEE